MKSDLGWDNILIRSQQKGKANSKGSQVDIIAKRQDNRGKILEKLSILYYVIAAFLLIYGIVEHDDVLVIFGVVWSVIALIAVLVSRDKHRENAWVECKNRKTKSTYDDMRKSIEEYKDYQASGDKEYRYKVHYFVSANGFVENALKYAIDNKVICYEYKNEKFELVTYWK